MIAQLTALAKGYGNRKRTGWLASAGRVEEGAVWPVAHLAVACVAAALGQRAVNLKVVRVPAVVADIWEKKDSLSVNDS